MIVILLFIYYVFLSCIRFVNCVFMFKSCDKEIQTVEFKMCTLSIWCKNEEKNLSKVFEDFLGYPLHL